jgi:hypothetical protein
MRGAEIVGCTVYDRTGSMIGHVHDLRFVPASAPASTLNPVPRYRLDTLVVGSAAIGHRLGFGRSAMAGPWPLTTIFLRLAARSYLVPWRDVERFERPRIDLRISRDELPRVLEEEKDGRR